MENNIITGLLYIVIGGIFSGTFAIPFKKNEQGQISFVLEMNKHLLFWKMSTPS